MSTQYVQKLVRDGILSAEGRGKYPLVSNCKAYTEHIRDGGDASHLETGEGNFKTLESLKMEKVAEEIKEKKAKMELSMGKVIPLETVMRGWQTRMILLSNTLIGARTELIDVLALSAATVCPEKPHCGKSGVPFI